MTWRLVGLGALIAVEVMLLGVPGIPYRFFWAFAIMSGATAAMWWLKLWLWVVLLGFAALMILLAKIDQWRAGPGRGP